MSPLYKWLALPRSERRLLLRAWLLLGLIRLGLGLLPFRTVQALVSSRIVLRWRTARIVDCPLDRVGWAVAVAGVYMPRATCLAQALTAQILLRRRGYAAMVRIGVTHTQERRLAAHAWVECSGQIVVGGSAEALARYTPLSSLPLERQHIGS